MERDVDGLAKRFFAAIRAEFGSSADASVVALACVAVAGSFVNAVKDESEKADLRRRFVDSFERFTT